MNKIKEIIRVTKHQCLFEQNAIHGQKLKKLAEIRGQSHDIINHHSDAKH